MFPSLCKELLKLHEWASKSASIWCLDAVTPMTGVQFVLVGLEFVRYPHWNHFGFALATTWSSFLLVVSMFLPSRSLLFCFCLHFCSSFVIMVFCRSSFYCFWCAWKWAEKWMKQPAKALPDKSAIVLVWFWHKAHKIMRLVHILAVLLGESELHELNSENNPWSFSSWKT